jgi:hypothetical protein
MVLPATKMEPATDLKPTISYLVENAVTTDTEAVREVLNGKKCITFNKPSQVEIVWTITTGVADTYEFRIKYLNTTGKTLTAKIKVFAADGTLMKEGTMEFTPTLADKWKTAATTTGTSINAGNYKVTLTAEDILGLSISGLEVQ